MNDAPSLKRADLGIAMQAGAEVAREAADIILVRDNGQTKSYKTSDCGLCLVLLRIVHWFCFVLSSLVLICSFSSVGQQL